MKKTALFLSLAAAVLLSCTKENDHSALGADETLVSLTASIPSSEISKASFDGDGAGIHADQCRLQVWLGDVLFYDRTVAVTEYKARFDDILLKKNEKYDFLFWADNKAGAFYNTDDLHKVGLAGPYMGCNDKRDAFSAALVDKTAAEAFSQDVLLQRPFAQLNVITTDVPSLCAQIPDVSEFIRVLPDKISLSVLAPTVFNVKTAQASHLEDISYTSPVYPVLFNTQSGAKNTLSMDYFFAPASEDNLVTVTYKIHSDSEDFSDIDYTFPNVPLRRNFRTNIIGSLIVVSGDINVEIKPAWSGEINY